MGFLKKDVDLRFLLINLGLLILFVSASIYYHDSLNSLQADYDKKVAKLEEIERLLIMQEKKINKLLNLRASIETDKEKLEENYVSYSTLNRFVRRDKSGVPPLSRYKIMGYALGRFHGIEFSSLNTNLYSPYIEFLKTYVDVPFTTTQFGQDAVLETDPDFKIPFVYHGVDHNLFKKLDPDRPLVEGGPTVNTEKARLGIDKTFNIIMIGVNQIRKQYNIALEAFAEFSKDKKDARLILHCARNTNYGWDMDALIGYLSDKNESEGKQPINKKVVF